jgi:hypothetical protein
VAAVDPQLGRRRAQEALAGRVALSFLPYLLAVGARIRLMWGARATYAGRVPLAIAVLAGAGLFWTRTFTLKQGLWGDELVSVIAYIHAGPSGIFGHYVPNDHMLFELLTWGSTGLIGDHSEAANRFWSFAPGVGGAWLMAWWLWRRLEAWIGAVFLVLACASPICLDLTSEARGYGLGFLAGVLMTIGADRFARTHTGGGLALLSVGALIGIWTLPVIVLPYLGIVAILLARRVLRRRVLIATALVGGASLLFYLPVLGDLLSSSEQQDGALVAWHAVLLGPTRDLLAPNVSLLFGHASVGVCEAIALVVLALGAVALWRRPERMLVLLLLAPANFTYLLLKLGGFYVVDSFLGHSQLGLLAIQDRFTSFLILPLLAVCAAGLVWLGRGVAGLRLPGSVTVRPFAEIVAVGAAVGSLIVLSTGDRLATSNAKLPMESYREVVQVVRGTRIGLNAIVTNSTHSVGFRYYLNAFIPELTPAALAKLFCTSPGPIVYIEHLLYSPRANTTCLRERGAVAISMPQRRALPTIVWILRGRRAG